MKQRIQQDLREALLQRDELKTGTLRMVLAAFVNKEKERGLPITKEQCQEILLSEVKKRKEAAEAFEKGGRAEMAAKERKELDILQHYLPEQISEAEIRAILAEEVQRVGAHSLEDLGKVMAGAMPRLRGRADGKLVGEIARSLLLATVSSRG